MRTPRLSPLLLLAVASATLAARVVQAQESNYRVEPVYTPPLERPPVTVYRDSLPRGAAGTLPTVDGAPFHVNLAGGEQQKLSEGDARRVVDQILRALAWHRDSSELVLAAHVALRTADRQVVDRQIEDALARTRNQVSGKVGRLSDSTRGAIERQGDEFRARALRRQEVLAFDQRVKGVRIENSGVRARWEDGRGIVAVSGRVFNTVEVENRPRLTATQAVQASRTYVGRRTKLAKEQPGRPELVILPYGKSMRFAWRLDVAAEEGTYRIWIDADTEKVLQLEPLFFSDSASGLVFSPSPTTGTAVRSFEIDAPSPATLPHRLVLSGVLDVNNSGADGVSSGDLTLTGTDFNTAPFNGTVVDRTSSSGYNSRFQEVNVYGWVYNNTRLMEALGSQTFPAITATVNHNNPCGFGINNACGGGSSVTFGIGSATTSTSTSSGALFNSGIDATVVTHEWGHVFTGLQMAVGGGSAPSALKEGLSDFWAATIHNNDTFGAWWAHNAPTPVQTGFVPRQAEQLDVFPEHRSFSTDGHADGQIIDWALWQSRTGLNGLSVLGTLTIDVNVLKALTTSGIGVSVGTTDKRVHDSFLDLLQQTATLFGTSASVNKLLSGFAQAGLLLSERDAVINISDDYLARSAGPPTFTIWTGRDYQFNASEGAVAANAFNTKFTVDVANDPAFTVNHVNSGVQSGVAVSAAGVPSATWTLPGSDWNSVKTGTFLYYKVTTTDNEGANVRTSINPGNGFLANVTPPRAVINESGTCDCTTASATELSGRRVPWVMLLPLAVVMVWRRRLRRPAR